MTTGIAIPTEGPVFRWHKSSHSGETNSCLELRTPPQRGKTRVRDSKDPAKPSVICTVEAWAMFVEAIRVEALGLPS